MIGSPSFFSFLPFLPSPRQKLASKAKKHQVDTSRYSLFIILYPIGISSEWWLMYQATTVTANKAVAALFYFFLGLYVPGGWQILSFLISQYETNMRQAR